MPNSSSPRRARSRAPSTLSSSHLILLAEKYASGCRPVFATICRATSSLPQSSSMMGAVRRHCQTMALAMGSPVARSHTTVVSRWLVMPMLTISFAESACLVRSSAKLPSWLNRDLLRVVLHPAGLGVDLAELAAHLVDAGALVVDEDGPRRGRPLVEGDHVLLALRGLAHVRSFRMWCSCVVVSGGASCGYWAVSCGAACSSSQAAMSAKTRSCSASAKISCRMFS